MASEYELTIDVDAPADAAWALIGDFDAVPRWFPKYVASTTEGDVRTLRNADGGELVERIVSRDDERRRYEYTVIAGPPLASHHASFEVVPTGGGCRILWRTAAVFKDPAIDAEERLAGAQRDGLARMKALIESGG